VAAFAVLAAITGRSVWLAWQQRSGDARAAAVYELVGQRTPPRPTDAPGAMAWLRLELDRYGRTLVGDRAQIYRDLAAARLAVPSELRAIADGLRAEPPVEDVRPIELQLIRQGTSLRDLWTSEFGGQPVVVTGRAIRVAGERSASASAITSRAIRRLTAASKAIEAELRARPLPAVPGDRPPRPVRIYAVASDGTLVSAPWIGDGTPPAEAASREIDLLGARPGLPSFAPEEFFFRFDPVPHRSAAAYSGFYLDLGGRGLVSTLMRPLTIDDRVAAVLALDLAFDIDWSAFAASIAPPMSGAAVPVPANRAVAWHELERALPPGDDRPLRSALAELAEREPSQGRDDSPLRHGLIDGRGAVAAFQVADSRWLVMLFPRAAPAFPFAALALLAGVLALLLAGFEYNRRSADSERRIAERALAEKQNLLNTMQVPLVVVDPNTDAIVSSNRAAESIGIEAGTRFADLVARDPRARAHYERMQVATPAPRRAYGLPVTVRDESGQAVDRYAVVRSVAVTAPIEALAADERHRLGILFVLDADADLALLQMDLERSAHRDERRRLAGLLSHGVDTLARVLEHALTRSDDAEGERRFAAWLAEYLERRLAVTGWLLDHWDDTPPLARDHVVDRQQARETVDRLRAIFEHVRADRVLRSRLHWDNGTLSADAVEGRVIDVSCDWPEPFELTLPVRGGFGLFLGEVLINAVRHGAPGTVPRLTVSCDRVRRELSFRVENACLPSAPTEPRGETYGGVAILRTLARLFDWRELTFARHESEFDVAWRAPVSQRPDVGQAD
jgi:hypothetical protein